MLNAMQATFGPSCASIAEIAAMPTANGEGASCGGFDETTGTMGAACAAGLTCFTDPDMACPGSCPGVCTSSTAANGTSTIVDIEAGIAAWLGAQMAMPASLHRAEFRLHNNPPMAVSLQGTGTSRPCGADALWQRHALSRLDEGEACWSTARWSRRWRRPTRLGSSRARSGPAGAVKRPSRFPVKVHFVWGFCTGAQGA